MFLASLLAAAHAAPIGEGWVGCDKHIDWDHIPGVSTTEERRIRGDSVQCRVLVSERGVSALLSRGISVQDYRRDHRRALVSGYHDGPAASLSLTETVARSLRAGMACLGRSREGIAIDGAWFGVPPGQGAPVVRILGGHHGDEPIAVEVALAIASALADGDGQDPSITALLDRATVWIVPAVNPDGLGEGSRNNAADVDLNRNYDYAWDAGATRVGQFPFSEPETRAVSLHARLERPHISLSLHAGAANLGWPWNYTEAAPQDALLMEILAQDYLSLCTAPGFWITQGAAWYTTHGDTNDWAYGRYGVLDYTLEVDTDKSPPPSEIAEIISQHESAILNFIATVPTLSGQVTDAATGQPIDALLTLDVPGAPFLTDPLSGSFYRIVPSSGLAAPHRVTASAPGYATSDAEIVDGRAEIALAKTTRVRPPAIPWILHSGATPAVQGGEVPFTLSQPGSAAIELTSGDSLPASAMNPGLWTVEIHDGPVWANVLLVEEPGGAWIDGWDRSGAVWGGGFGAGTRALGLWGDLRQPIELAVLSEGETDLMIDTTEIAIDEEIDIVLLSGGAVLGIESWERPPSPASATEGLRAVGCACSTSAGHRLGHLRSDGRWGWVFALTSAMTLTRRRWS